MVGSRIRITWKENVVVLVSEWQKEGTAVPHGRRQFSIYVKGFDFYRKGGNFWGCLVGGTFSLFATLEWS